MLRQVLITFTLALRATSLVLLVPLYVYPGSSTDSAWQPLYSAIEAQPKVEWQIIVNPSSGPGPNSCPGSSGSAVDANWQAGIAKLNGYANVQTLGYVWAEWGTRAIADVESDINIYAKWASCSGVDVAVDGIFFDDFVNSTSTTPQNALTLSYGKTVTKYAGSKLPSATTPIVLNPGSPYTSQKKDFLALADFVIDFEDYASLYTSPGTITSISTAEGASYLDNSAFVIHDLPTTQNPTSWIHTMIAHGVGATYLTQDCCYNVLNSTLLLQIAAAVAAG